VSRTRPGITIVTGAGGWLGTALLHSLTDEQHGVGGTVRVLVRDPGEAETLARLGDSVEAVVGDLRDPESLRPLFAELDGPADLIHTAGVIHPERVADFEAINAEGTRTLARLARVHDIRRMVHVSSNSPFGTNTHPGDRFRNDEPYAPYYGYGRSKMHAELAVLDEVERGLDAVIVRPPWFYGPHQPPRQTTFFRMVRTGRFPVFGRGEQQRSMVYVDNLVDGVRLAQLADVPAGRGWWIADARPYSVAEIVDTVGRALSAEGFDVSPNHLRVPDLVGRIAERADGFLQGRGIYHQQIHVLGEMNKNIACDIDVARSELGYEPQIELFEGMRRSIRWCLDEGYEL
jgi:nucleoside-diphosphate-sugar epimerase